MQRNQLIRRSALAVALICSSLAAQQAPHATAAQNTGTKAARPNTARLDALRELSSAFEEISQRTGRAVVQIFVRSYTTAEGTQSGSDILTAENSSGSGIIMSPDGYILTNAHVVKNAHSIRVQLNIRAEAEAREQGDRTMNRPLAGTLVGVDRDSDLAVIKISKDNLPFLKLGNSDELKQGQVVLALGNPLGLDNSVSFGVVSAVARQIKPDDSMVYIQTDAPINPGNSGGPLVDAEGRVVGINTMIFSQSGGSEGIGFAIPSNLAQGVYTQLKKQGHVHRAQLGLMGETITPDIAEGLSLEMNHGVIVSDIEPGGAADHAGIQVDDIIVAMNGKRVSTVHELEAGVFRLLPGTKVVLAIERGTNAMTIPTVTEEQKDTEMDALANMVDPVKNVVPQLGIVGLDVGKEVLQLLPDLRRPAGVVVAVRKTIAPYFGPALESGDVIYEVNRKVINNVEQLRQTLSAMKPGQPVALLLEREGHLIYVALELD